MNGSTLSELARNISKKLLAVTSLLLPALAHAEVPYLFPVDSSDLSLQYLLFMFGPISQHAGIKNPNSVNILIGYITPLMVSAAIVAAAFVGMRSVFVGSGSGHLLGERFSSLMTPLKILVGVGGLIPDGTGYAPVHKWLFWMVINGIGFANQVWGVLVNEHSMGYGWNQDVQIESGSGVDWMTEQLLYVAMTKSYLEQMQPSTYIDIYPEAGTVSRLCDITVAARDNRCTENNQVVLYPVIDPGDSNDTTLASAEFSALLQSFMERLIRDPMVQYGTYQIISNENKVSQADILEFFGQEYCYNQIMNYQRQLEQLLQPFALEEEKKPLDEKTMLEEGWIGAAFYYWKLWSGGGGSPLADKVIDDFASPRTDLRVKSSILSSGEYKDLYDYSVGLSEKSPAEKIGDFVENLYSVKNQSPENSASYEKIAGTASSSGLKEILSLSSSNFLIHSFLFTNSNAENYREVFDLNYDFSSDRFGSFITHNAKIIVNIIDFLQTLVIIMFVFAMVSVMRGMNSILFVLLYCLFTTLFMITPLLVLIGTTSLMGSMYASVIPGMIFGTAVFGWFVKVVEMIISAPMAAIAMISPSEDETAAILHVMMQLLMTITRPALMLIGFVLAAKLCQISIMFVGGAFNYLGQELSSLTGSGGMIFLVMMYEFMTMTTIAFCVRAFGFINIIPDTVFAVVSLQSQDPDSDQLISVFEEAGQQGAEQIGQVISMLNGLSKMMLSIAQKSQSD